MQPEVQPSPDLKRAVKLVLRAGRHCTILNERMLWAQRTPRSGGCYIDVEGLLEASNPTGYVLHARECGRR